MDYKYIEQLLDRYFLGETSRQEELILKAFFGQEADSVPEELRQWMPLFAAIGAEEGLGDDFDRRILALTAEPAVVKARPRSLSLSMRPLLRAAAVVGVVFMLGTAIDRSMQPAEAQGDEINYSAYKDTYDDPTMAYDQMQDALRLMSEGFSKVRQADSARIDSFYTEVR